MRRIMCAIGMLAVLLATKSGCGDDGPPLAEAGGTVTYQGEPLENASVVFVPDSGTPAMGRTDAEGRFTLNTKGESGAMIGPGKVSITAVEQLNEIETNAAGRMPTEEELAAASRSLIPQKYGNVRTSGLTATISAEEENELTFEL